MKSLCRMPITMLTRHIGFSALAILYGCASGNWDHKAVRTSEEAAKIVGPTFTAHDGKLYRVGIQHVLNQRQRLGSYTISQIIEGQRQRDQRAREAREREADVRKKAAEAAREATAEAGEEEDVAATFSILRRSPELDAMIRGHVIDGNHLNLAIDADYWEPLSDQDKTRLKDVLFAAWSQSYNHRHGTSGQSVGIRFFDLAQRIVDSIY